MAANYIPSELESVSIAPYDSPPVVGYLGPLFQSWISLWFIYKLYFTNTLKNKINYSICIQSSFVYYVLQCKTTFIIMNHWMMWMAKWPRSKCAQD